MPSHLLRLCATVLALALPICGASDAADVSGSQLLALCTTGMTGQNHLIEAAECKGFITGVADSFDCVEDNRGFTWNSSAKVAEPELVDLVVQYIQTHPGALASDGHRAVGAALAAAFPCEAKTATN